VGRIDGGTALNIVPNQCTVDFEIRNIGQDNAQTVLDQIVGGAAKIAKRQRPRFPGAGIRIDVLNSYPGLVTASDAEVVTFVRKIVEYPQPLKVAFGTEGGLFSTRLGVPTVICGPGSMEQGHRPDEFVALSQLEACDRMMDRLLKQCC
jgi:acetylornithine deacetylase